MKTVFDQADRQSILHRLDALQPGSERKWGKMTVAQMLAHCAKSLETASGDRPMKQAFIGKIITPLIRSSVWGDKPFGRSSPTDPTFVVTDERDFATERAKVLEILNRIIQRGPEAAATQTHPFFGKLTGEAWGQLIYKHLDHHLQQFGV